MKALKAFIIICLLIITAWFGLRFLTLGRFTLSSKADFEALAKNGEPIAQAISDYRSDHGLLPEKLDYLVPAYLNAPLTNGWRFDGGSLTRYTGVGRTFVSYSFLETNGWWVYGEAESHSLNASGPVIKLPVLTGEALFSARLLEYESRISHHVKEREWYKSKINFLGLAKREDLLRKECERSIALFPNWWFPQMVLAELDITNFEAGRQFTKWVHDHSTFMNYWYLARYHRDRSDIPAAIEALEKAASCPFQAYPRDASRVGSAFGFEAAKFAYENQRYDLTLKLCKQWGTLGPDYGAQEWRAFEAAAEIALGQFESAVDHALQANNYRMSSWARNLPDLLRAAQEHNSNFVYQAGDIPTQWSLFEEPGF
jgi:hypothetical protein